MKQRFIALVDADNFFASCEQLFNPSLEGKPVCVLSNNDGCVIARSKEAKKLGIKMGMPYFMAKKEYPSAVYLSSNFTLYHDISNRLRDIFRRYSENIDIYSVDEAFFDVTGLDKVYNCDFETLAKRIRDEVKREVGVWVSVGISNSKTLSKVAVHKAKSLSGVYVIKKENIEEELKYFPVSEVWGIGKQTTKFFRAFGIFYASEILKLDEGFLRKNLGIKGLELKQELSGENFIGIQKEEKKPKSIQRTCAFPEFTQDKDYIQKWLFYHLHNSCRCARRDNLKAGSIGVMLRTKDFRVFYLEAILEKKSNSELELVKYAVKLFERMFDGSIIFRASGIVLNGLEEIKTEQLSLTGEQNKKKEEISYVLDKIEEKFGKGSIMVGQIGKKRKRSENKLKNG
ncbi:hypothetical protein IKQ26_06470 [bacterium]|nr:hypothetical protein [bacterium]